MGRRRCRCGRRAVLAGAGKIIAVDVADRKLEKARRFGATDTVNRRARAPTPTPRPRAGDPGHCDIIQIDGGTGPGAAERRRGYRNATRRHGPELPKLARPDK